MRFLKLGFKFRTNAFTGVWLFSPLPDCPPHVLTLLDEPPRDCPPHKLSNGGQTVQPPTLGQSNHHGTESNAHPPDQKASALPHAPFMRVSWTILGGDNQNGWGTGHGPTKRR